MKTLKSLIFCLIVILGVSSFAKAAPLSLDPSTILYVKQDGTSLLCTSWDAACDLQTALSTAILGDQIWVAVGTYKPTTSSNREATFQLESGVAIYGGFPADDGTWEERDWVNNLTTLSGDIGIGGDSADNSYHVVTGSGVDATAILDGFTISGGNANSSSFQHGGGMNNNYGSPTLTNITFSSNSADYGSGIRNNHSSPVLTNVTFSGNSANGSGGGMANDYSSSPTLINVTFSGNAAFGGQPGKFGGGMVNGYSSNPTLSKVTFTENSAYSGGGMYNYQSNPTLLEVTFSNNSVTQSGGGMYNYQSSPALTNVTFSGNTALMIGGGMSNDYSDLTLTNVTFTENSAFFGGGMNNFMSNPMLSGVTFVGNTAYEDGGGMANTGSSPSLINVTFSNNTVSGSDWTYDGGMWNRYSEPTLTNVTFINNSAAGDHAYGGGMQNEYSSPTLTNTILWGNTPDQISGWDSTIDITYSDIQGDYTGETNINLDPLLGPLADNGGFTQTHALGAESPAIDAGNPINCPAIDQRGYPRPVDGDRIGLAVCDMGAYEYGSSSDGFTLTVVIVGSGAVAKSSEELKYPLGEVVTLTATADPGWTFTGWGGDESGMVNPLEVTITGNTEITANWEQIFFLYLPIVLK